MYVYLYFYILWTTFMSYHKNSMLSTDKTSFGYNKAISSNIHSMYIPHVNTKNTSLPVFESLMQNKNRFIDLDQEKNHQHHTCVHIHTHTHKRTSIHTRARKHAHTHIQYIRTAGTHTQISEELMRGLTLWFTTQYEHYLSVQMKVRRKGK